MRRFSIVLLALALGATAAFPYLGQVVGSFKAPILGCGGLAISKEYLYVLQCPWPHYLHRCHPITGSVFSSYRLPDTVDYYWGLAYGPGGYLWVAEPQRHNVYLFNATYGFRYGSWSTGDHGAAGLTPRCTGDGGAGTDAIIVTDWYPSLAFVHKKITGSVITSFPIAYPSENDCAYDWRNRVVWLGDEDSPYVVYGYRPDGSILASFDIPSPPGYWGAGGLAYRGEYLWLSCSTEKIDTIYRIHCPARIGVEPASVGKVKALFR